MNSAREDQDRTPTTSGPQRPDLAETAPPLSQADLALDSTALLRGGRAITIRHNGEIYRLQSTRQGKLILTK